MQHPPHPYLEMEASTSYGEMDYNNTANEQQEQQHYLNQPIMDHVQPDPGCFCLGYNMLDYIISAAPPKPRPSMGKKQRLNGVLRPVRLPRVTESATMIDHVGRPIDTRDYHIDMMSEVMDTTAELSSSSVSPIKKIRSVDPEGMYLPPTENFYFTTAQQNDVTDDRYNNSSSPSTDEYNETRRQGVDL